LGALGLGDFDKEITLRQYQGNHYDWESLFNPILAKEIYEYLLEKTFDLERHKLLCQLNIQRDLGELSLMSKLPNAYLKNYTKA